MIKKRLWKKALNTSYLLIYGQTETVRFASLISASRFFNVGKYRLELSVEQCERAQSLQCLDVYRQSGVIVSIFCLG